MIRLSWCRWSLVGLLVLQLAWFSWLGPPTGSARIVVLILAAGPLAFALPFAWSLRPRPLVVTGLLLLIYFSFAVMEAWASPTARVPALLQIALILAFFTALATIRRQPARRR
ncbi:DUF2069 domain-containing protein [Wenzhouxiangella limi]|uniref:DUF2069 domain-containing protein n=1 Tax=Wenzhouxiangella limi TaxID=2707351 RepID=A0A845UTU4_9GAMM|nr:DUF2069 domain-containing protein [Wenzhouxiangella limi]NDY94927.1 DUF2069 domain-containing protein [Wenzhouxiangella limi]